MTIALIIYIVVALGTIPYLGRQFAKNEKRRPRASNEVSSTAAAILYGSIWPLTLVLFACYYLHKYFGSFVRLIVTGSKKKS